MKNFCSISDKNYLNKLLTLYNSLLKTQKTDFILNVLCLDDFTHSFLKNKKTEKINPILVSDLENGDFLLKSFKLDNIPCSEAIANAHSQKKDPKYIQFCWALASYFCWHLLENKNLPDILYIDSDLYFYEDVQKIYDEIGEKSIGIIRHRIDYIPTVGEYNVGIVFFKNDYVGKKCSKWWKDVLLDPNNQYSKEYGTCGDQKYLELFSPLFGKDNVCVIDDTIGHLAPWNVTFHKYKNEKILWEGKEQTLFFFHFAHFVPDFTSNSYRSSYKNEWVWGIPENSSTFVKKLYDDYFLMSQESEIEIKSFKE